VKFVSGGFHFRSIIGLGTGFDDVTTFDILFVSGSVLCLSSRQVLMFRRLSSNVFKSRSRSSEYDVFPGP